MNNISLIVQMIILIQDVNNKQNYTGTFCVSLKMLCQYKINIHTVNLRII